MRENEPEYNWFLIGLILGGMVGFVCGLFFAWVIWPLFMG